MTPPFSAFLTDAQKEVEHQLRTFMALVPADRLREAMEYSVFNGGKRIRPALCYATAGIFGAKNSLTHRASAALELIHAYSLIHDDLPAMDDDDLRRGKPTCHIAYDEATAILAGDALQALAFDILASPVSGAAEVQLKLIQTLAGASGAGGMVLGQALDLAAVNSPLDLERLETMHRHKTGALIEASVTMGAVASGRATGEELGTLAQYGSAVGLAFQVKDDILDVESSTETLGKTQGADHALNKPTYTSLLGVEGAKHKLEELHETAKDAASFFGESGNTLSSIADFIVQRTH